MKFRTIKYSDYEGHLPQSGKCVVGQQDREDIIVYQAFNPRISNYAVQNQKFGGRHYKFTRMSWIKPNFLWMMYRAGWAMKEHPQRILAIRLPRAKFEEVLKKAVHAQFEQDLYGSVSNWRAQLENSAVRLQWDPDHDPYGNKLKRKAIQLGLKGEVLKAFAQDWIIEIQDITPFVHQQKRLLDAGRLSDLMVMEEKVIEVHDPQIRKNIGLS